MSKNIIELDPLRVELATTRNFIYHRLPLECVVVWWLSTILQLVLAFDRVLLPSSFEFFNFHNLFFINFLGGFLLPTNFWLNLPLTSIRGD